MKKTILRTILGAALVFSLHAGAQAQLSLSINIGRQPAWGPTGYNHVDYYYLPDIECYYDVSTGQYIYQDGSQWIFANNLPPRYRGYDLYSGYKVVVNRPRPYLNFSRDRVSYGRYKNWGGGRQPMLRESRNNGNRPGNNGGSRPGNSGAGNGGNRPGNNNSARPQGNTARPQGGQNQNRGGSQPAGQNHGGGQPGGQNHGGGQPGGQNHSGGQPGGQNHGGGQPSGQNHGGGQPGGQNHGGGQPGGQDHGGGQPSGNGGGHDGHH